MSLLGALGEFTGRKSVLGEFTGRVYWAHAQLWACHGTGRLAVDAGWGSEVSEMACNPSAAAPAVRNPRSNLNPVTTLHPLPPTLQTKPDSGFSWRRSGGPRRSPATQNFFYFFFTLVTGPRRSVSLKLSDTEVYERGTESVDSGSRNIQKKAQGVTIGHGYTGGRGLMIGCRRTRGHGLTMRGGMASGAESRAESRA